MFCRGMLHPEVPSLTLSYTIFGYNRYTFPMISLSGISLSQSSSCLSSHKAITRERKCCLSCCPQLHPLSIISRSTDRLHVSHLFFSIWSPTLASRGIATKGILHVSDPSPRAVLLQGKLRVHRSISVVHNSRSFR